MNVQRLTDRELLIGIHDLQRAAQKADGQFLLYLIEIDERRLHLREAFPSLHEFCRKRLGLSEGATWRRTNGARLVKRFPRLLADIEEGRVHLSALAVIGKVLTESNLDELVRLAYGKNREQLAKLVARIAPQADVATSIRKLPTSSLAESAGAPAAGTPGAVAATAPLLADVSGAAAGSLFARELVEAARPVESRPRIEPLSEARYRLQLTMGEAMRQKLDRVQQLARHRQPSGDIVAMLEAGLDLLLAKLEKERLGKLARPTRTSAAPLAAPVCASAPPPPTAASIHTSAPTAASTGGYAAAPAQASAPRATKSAYIPRAVRRAVFARDGEQCTYVDAGGRRCEATTLLELDHRHARGKDGSNDIENLRVFCQGHNKLHAEDDFGRAHIARQIHLRQRGSETEVNEVSARRDDSRRNK